MSPKNTKLYFKNYYKKFPIPFVIYADFECFTKPLQTCQPYPNDSYTYSYQKHEPSGFCLYLKGLDGINKLFNPIVYTKKTDNEDISKIFVEKIEKITHKIYKEYYKKPKTMKITTQEQEEFNKSTICHICEKEFLEDDSTARMLKVRDHCHFTGEYRGAAHNSCNIQGKKPLILPVIFHNLQGYDSHLFIKQFVGIKGKLTCIPSTEEKYILFSKNIKVGEYKDKKGKPKSINFEIRFIDSFKFLQTSLANLVSNLQSSDFCNTNSIIKNIYIQYLDANNLYGRTMSQKLPTHGI